MTTSWTFTIISTRKLEMYTRIQLQARIATTATKENKPKKYKQKSHSKNLKHHFHNNIIPLPNESYLKLILILCRRINNIK